MSLASKLAQLAARLGTEIKGLIRPGHPGLARAWVNFGCDDEDIEINASYNIAGVTRLATGRYRVTFATPFANTHYCWLAFARSNTNSSSMRMAIARDSSDKKTTNYVELICATAAGSLADTSEINLVVYS